MKVLVVHLYGREIGRFTERDDGRIVFSYSRQWLDEADAGRAHALSVSLPLSEDELPPGPVEAFIAGLLPDSTVHRRLLASRLGIAAEPSDFDLLARLGGDCAGAITVSPESGSSSGTGNSYCQELSEEELSRALDALPRRPLLVDGAEGVLASLAGVNDKAAVAVHNGRIALPHHGYPTSYILKTDIAGLPDSIRVEHFCLRLAAECGQSVPKTKIRRAGEHVFMLMARYDRKLVARGNGPELVRVHQEDFCQALGLRPEQKYERRGGMGWKDCFGLMRLTVEPLEATKALLDRAIFQYLVGNPDAHGKNYSLLYRPDGAIRLAPFYDLNNAAAYRSDFKNIKPLMAMAIGGEFDRTKVELENWRRFADDCGLQFSLVRESLQALAEMLLEAAPRLRGTAKGTDDDSDRLDLLAADVMERSRMILTELTRADGLRKRTARANSEVALAIPEGTEDSSPKPADKFRIR